MIHVVPTSSSRQSVWESARLAVNDRLAAFHEWRFEGLIDREIPNEARPLFKAVRQRLGEAPVDAFVKKGFNSPMSDTNNFYAHYLTAQFPDIQAEITVAKGWLSGSLTHRSTVMTDGGQNTPIYLGNGKIAQKMWEAAEDRVQRLEAENQRKLQAFVAALPSRINQKSLSLSNLERSPLPNGGVMLRGTFGRIELEFIKTDASVFGNFSHYDYRMNCESQRGILRSLESASGPVVREMVETLLQGGRLRRRLILVS